MTKAKKDPAGPAVQNVSLDDLHPDPANVRRRTERGLKNLDASVAAYGLGRSIVCDANNVVRAGNGTLEAAQRAGFTKALIVDPGPDELVVVRRSDWTPTQAVGYAIQDNRASDPEHAAWDDTALAETLRALQSEDFDMAAVGFTSDEVDRLCDGLGTDMLPPGADGKEYDESIADEVEYCECPECGHRWPK